MRTYPRIPTDMQKFEDLIITHDGYHTTDIALAATLRCLNIPLVDVEMEGTRGTFVFNSVPDTVLREYNFGSIKVEPQQFHGFIKQLAGIVRRKTQ